MSRSACSALRALANPPFFPHTPLPPGTPGYIAAQLRVSPEAGEAMEQALEDTERIDPDEQHQRTRSNWQQRSIPAGFERPNSFAARRRRDERAHFDCINVLRVEQR